MDNKNDFPRQNCQYQERVRHACELKAVARKVTNPRLITKIFLSDTENRGIFMKTKSKERLTPE
jgi:hypothetical protein